MTKWFYEAVSEEAKKFSSRAEFQRGSSSAYQRAIKMGWLDDVCKHMVAGVKGSEHVNGTTLECVWKEALKYKTRNEFKKGSYWAYTLAMRNGWLTEVCKYMVSGYKGRKSTWTRESVAEVAKQCQTRTEFMRKHVAAYNNATKNGWLDEVCAHMQSGLSKPKKWTREAIQAEALNYERRSDFHHGSSGAYARAIQMGWLDDVCSHMAKGEREYQEPDQEWTFESVEAEALRYTSLSDFFQSLTPCLQRGRAQGLAQ